MSEARDAIDDQQVAVAGPVVAAAAVLQLELWREMPGERQITWRKPGAEQGLLHLELYGRILARLPGAEAGLDRLGVDDAAEADGEFDELADMRLAFALIGVEQAGIGDAVDDVGQLPGKIGGIADAGAHALAEEGRGLVRGIAGEQQPATAPLLRNDGMKGVDCGALEFGVLRRDPARQQLPDLCGLGDVVRILLGKNSDLPAPARAGAADIGRRPPDITMLKAVVAEIVALALE